LRNIASNLSIREAIHLRST